MTTGPGLARHEGPAGDGHRTAPCRGPDVAGPHGLRDGSTHVGSPVRNPSMHRLGLRALLRSRGAHALYVRLRSLRHDAGTLVLRLVAGPWSAVAVSWRHPPDVVLGAAALVELDGQGCLPGGLTGDQSAGRSGSRSLSRRAAMARRSIASRIASRACRASSRWRSGRCGRSASFGAPHGRGDPPPGVSALARAHGNGSCHRETGLRQGPRQLRFPVQECTESC